MIVGVFAGTEVDTKMGVEILENCGFETISFPVAKNPEEQTKLQYFSKTQLEELIIKKAEIGKSQGMEKIFIYCNSLSAAIDYKHISKILGIEIITPLETYENIDESSKNIFILAANGISAFKIESIIQENNTGKFTMTFGNLSVVENIEEGKNPKEIISDLNLKGLIDYLENIKEEKYKIDTILLGCTHFPYLKEEIQKQTNLKIIDPAEDMIKRLGNS